MIYLEMHIMQSSGRSSTLPKNIYSKTLGLSEGSHLVFWVGYLFILFSPLKPCLLLSACNSSKIVIFKKN